MRLTARTNLALRTLMFCAVNNGRIVRKQDIAETCNVSENHLAQVINGLSRKGFITTMRGRNGGLTLARSMDEISVGTVAREFESTPLAHECLASGSEDCPLMPACRLRQAMVSALDAFFSILDEMTVGDLVRDNDPLVAILALPGAATSAAEPEVPVRRVAYA